jgi:hypothetical protein
MASKAVQVRFAAMVRAGTTNTVDEQPESGAAGEAWTPDKQFRHPAGGKLVASSSRHQLDATDRWADARPHTVPDITGAGSELVHQVAEGEPLNRRDALCVIAGVALSDSLAQLFTVEPHEMGRALDAAASDDSLCYYETMVDRMMMVFECTGPGAVLGPALEHFSAIRRLVEKRQSVASRKRLTRAASKLGTLLGLFAYEDEWQSRKWFAIAHRAAVESGDDVLMGWAGAGESLLDYYGGRARESLRTLEAAGEWVQEGVVGAIVSARAARAHAALGEQRQALEALQCAHELLDGSPSQQRELFAFHDAQLAFYSAACNGRLGREADAEDQAARALLLYETHPQYMDPALVRFDLAAARLTRRQPDVEGAVAAARDAIELLPPEHRTGPVRQRAKNLVRQLRRYQAEPAVRDFVELAATL